MNPALYEKMKRLAHPLTPDGNLGEHCACFSGTVEQAQWCPLLTGIGVPGEPGGPKVMRTFKLDDGRKVQVWRHTARLVVARVWMTASEKLAEEDDVRRRQADAEALKRAAAYDKLASDVTQKLKEQPATEAEFRLLARDAFWRLWSTFSLGFLGSHEPHGSGFRFTAATVEMLGAFAHLIRWALECDGTVLVDDERRFGELRWALDKACKYDLPLQRFIDQVKAAAPLEQEGGAS